MEKHEYVRKGSKRFFTCSKTTCFAHKHNLCLILVDPCDRYDGTCPFYQSHATRELNAKKAALRNYQNGVKPQDADVEEES